MELQEFLKRCASEQLVDALGVALSAAREGNQQASPAHVANALLDDVTVRSRLVPETTAKAKASLSEIIHAEPRVEAERVGTITFLRDLVDPTLTLAKDSGAERVSPLVFLVTCLSYSGWRDAEDIRTQEALRRAGVTPEILLKSTAQDQVHRADFTYKSLGFGIDLTAKARSAFWKSCPLIGMEQQLKRLVVELNSRNSVVLLGEPGVGKSAIIDGLAYHIALQTRPLIPPDMDDWTIVSITRDAIMADMGVQGKLESRLQNLLSFFRKNPKVIPFFDEVHTLFDTHDDSSTKIATSLKPPMANGEFCCIGATTDREYGRFVQADEALTSRFTRVLLPEPDFAAAYQILRGSLKNLISQKAKSLGVTVDDPAVERAVQITSTYQQSERLPRKAIRFLKKVVENKCYEISTSATDAAIPRQVTAEFVEHIAKVEYGFPVDQDKVEYWQRFKERLCEKLPGQEKAIRAMLAWLFRRARNYVLAENPKQPRARFLFLASPGAPARTLALAVADEMIQDRNSIVIENMQQYSTKESLMKLVGAPPGYIGHEDTKTVFTKVANRPNSMVILENFECAHAELGHDLTSMIAGEAKDSKGNEVQFSQCIFVLTTSLALPEKATTRGGRISKEHLSDLGGIWSPALLNQIDVVAALDAPRQRTMESVSEVLERANNASLNELLTPETRLRLEKVTEEGDIDVKDAVDGWLQQHAETILDGSTNEASIIGLKS